MKVIATLLVGGIAAAASAQITPIGPFVGDISETWESFQNYFENPNFYEDANGAIVTFGGMGAVSSPLSGQGGLIVVYEPDDGATFGLGLYGSAQVSDGEQGSGVNAGQPGAPARIDFAAPVVDFGGYWGASDIDGRPSVPIVFDFYDANGALIGSQTAQYGDPNAQGTLLWFGWNSVTPIATVVYTGDFVVNDGLQANLVPTPAAALLFGVAGLATRRRR
jgi:hypothetical protein